MEREGEKGAKAGVRDGVANKVAETVFTVQRTFAIITESRALKQAVVALVLDRESFERALAKIKVNQLSESRALRATELKVRITHQKAISSSQVMRVAEAT